MCTEGKIFDVAVDLEKFKNIPKHFSVFLVIK